MRGTLGRQCPPWDSQSKATAEMPVTTPHPSCTLWGGASVYLDLRQNPNHHLASYAFRYLLLVDFLKNHQLWRSHLGAAGNKPSTCFAEEDISALQGLLIVALATFQGPGGHFCGNHTPSLRPETPPSDHVTPPCSKHSHTELQRWVTREQSTDHSASDLSLHLDHLLL